MNPAISELIKFAWQFGEYRQKKDAGSTTQGQPGMHNGSIWQGKSNAAADALSTARRCVAAMVTTEDRAKRVFLGAKALQALGVPEPELPVSMESEAEDETHA